MTHHHTCRHCEFYTGGECTNPVVTESMRTVDYGEAHFVPPPTFACSGFTPSITKVQRPLPGPERGVGMVRLDPVRMRT